MLNHENVLIIPWTEYYESHDQFQCRPLADLECEKGPDASPNTKELLKISWIRLSASLPLCSQPSVCNKGPQHPSLLRLIFNPL